MSSSSKRIRGLAISRPLLVGSTATPLSATDRITAPPDHTHKWTVAIRSAASYPLPPVSQTANLGHDENVGISTRGRETEGDYHKVVGGKDDISYFVKRVQFKLHETYAQPTRNVEKPPYQVTETGWGEFEIQIKVFFTSEANEKPVTFYHHLKLHPWVPAIAPVPSAPSVAADVATPLTDGVAASTVGDSQSHIDPIAAIPPDTTSNQADTEIRPDHKEQNTISDSLGAAASSAEARSAPNSALSSLTAQTVAAPAVSFPPVVHSWQYEEIVFPEPTEAFYEALVAHPPSPLPTSSAQAFTDPSAYLAFQARQQGRSTDPNAPTSPPHPLHNPAGQLFDALSQEAAFNESKRLDDARIFVVDAIEKSRLDLIQKERELRALKAKLGVS